MQCSWDQSSRRRRIISWTVRLLQIPCWKRLFRHCFVHLGGSYDRCVTIFIDDHRLRCRIWRSIETLRWWIVSQTDCIPVWMTKIVASHEKRHLADCHRWQFWANWKNRQVKNSSSNPSPLPSQTKRFVLHIDEIDMGTALSKISVFELIGQKWTVFDKSGLIDLNHRIRSNN